MRFSFQAAFHSLQSAPVNPSYAIKTLPFLLASVLSVLLLLSCEKEHVSTFQPCEPAFPLAAVTDTCFSAPTMFGFSPYPGMPKSILSFTINPNNVNEIALYSDYNAPGFGDPGKKYTFWTVDACEGQRKPRWRNQNGVKSSLDWSTSGWIILYDQAMKSWAKYHPKTEELIGLNMGEFFSRAQWLTDSTILINETIITGQRQETFTEIRDLNGNVLDTLPKRFSKAAIRNEFVFGYVGYEPATLAIYDTKNRVLTDLMEVPPEKAFYHYSWMNDEELWLVRRDGLYRFNIKTRDLSLLKDTSCDNYFYDVVFPYSESPDLLYVYRVDYRYRSEGYIGYSKSINLLNIHTLEEREIRFFN